MQVVDAVSCQSLQQVECFLAIDVTLALGRVLVTMWDLKEAIVYQILSQHASNWLTYLILNTFFLPNDRTLTTDFARRLKA